MRSPGLRACVGALALLGGSAASAQQLPLDQYLDASAFDTPLQFSAGTAIQATCAVLARPENGAENNPDPQQQDLYLRCNEIVQTAVDLNNPDPNSTIPGRSLGFGDQQFVDTLQQYAGEELTALSDLATRAPSGQFANIAGRLNALRLGVATGGIRGRTASLETRGEGNREAFAAGVSPEDRVPRSLRNSVLPYQSLLSAAEQEDASESQQLAAPVEAPWGWFLDATYGFGDRDATVNEDGFEFDSYSATLGIDYNTGSSVIGASIGYDNYKADFETLGSAVVGGDADVNGVSASVFGAIFGERFSLNAIGSYGEPNSDVQRRVSYDENTMSVCTNCGTTQVLTGRPGTRFFSLAATLAYDARVGSWDLTPSFSFSVRDAEVDSYVETNDTVNGGLALAFERQSIDSNRSIMALDLSKAISRNFGILTPTFRAEWHHEFKDEARTLVARFAEAPNNGVEGGNCFACFRMITDTPDEDFAVLGAGLSFLFPGRLQAYAYAESLQGAQNFDSTTFAVGLRGQF